jgi:type IV pilus assembly protein PilW
MPLHVQGYDSPATVPAPLSACLPNANHLAGTDILVVRRADSAAIAPTGAVAGQAYLQTNLASHVLDVGSSAAYTLLKKDGTTPADLRKYLVNIYYVSPCSTPTGAGTPATCTGSDDTIPTLKRLELSQTGGVTAFKVFPLVEGIENLQLDYGVDTTNDGSPDSYTAEPAVTAWKNVMTIRVNLLARSNDKALGHQSGKTYNLGLAGPAGPFTDNYKRHVFSELVRVINPSGRREQ